MDTTPEYVYFLIYARHEVVQGLSEGPRPDGLIFGERCFQSDLEAVIEHFELKPFTQLRDAAWANDNIFLATCSKEHWTQHVEKLWDAPAYIQEDSDLNSFLQESAMAFDSLPSAWFAYFAQVAEMACINLVREEDREPIIFLRAGESVWDDLGDEAPGAPGVFASDFGHGARSEYETSKAARNMWT